MLINHYFRGFLFFFCAVFTTYAQNIPSRLVSLQSKVVSSFDKSNDLDKKNAAEFLINNIEIQTSIECKWFDSSNCEIVYDELSFDDFIAAKDQFEAIKKSGAYHKLDTIADLDQITEDLLIKNTEMAYDAWKNNKWSSSYSFDVFKEYILPYRVSTEPLQDWRDDYKWYYDHIKQENLEESDPLEICKKVLQANTSFKFKLFRDDPLPLLGPKNILFRNHGNCADIANLNVFALRLLGVASTFDFTPHWGASSNRHMWNTVIDKEGKHIPFDNENLVYNTQKRFAKVFRYTFSKQNNSLAVLHESKEIPNCFLRRKNIIDVTKEYTAVSNIDYTFKSQKSDISYICVFNKGYWHITDWSSINPEGKSRFKNLGRNIVYLPAFSKNGILQLAKAPILLADDGQAVTLTPNFQDTFDCILSNDNALKLWANEENSTKIKDSEDYTLIYWSDGEWVKHGTVKAVDSKVSFEKVPKNTLFILLSSEIDGFERPFLINPKNNEIIWY